MKALLGQPAHWQAQHHMRGPQKVPQIVSKTPRVQGFRVKPTTEEKATESIIIDLDKGDKDLILTMTESTILEILPELTSDKKYYHRY